MTGKIPFPTDAESKCLANSCTFGYLNIVVDIMLNSPCPSISGGGLTGKYNLYKVTLHWGALSTAGSEHTLDSSAYPLEVNILLISKLV